ncbi:MAG: BPL-N domain-containing protein [Thermoplasmatota archaeon]
MNSVQAALAAILLITPVAISLEIQPGHESPDAMTPPANQTIQVALYDSISPSVRQLSQALNYTWQASQAYRLQVSLIGMRDVLDGSLEGYDVLVIGASGRQYFHSLLPAWRTAVRQFIEDGGGYLGICGGANLVSRGIEHPDGAFDYFINAASLDIVDVYLNDDQTEEWQYLWKDTGEDHIPLLTRVDRSHPVFQEHGSTMRHIVYGGGPGMYPAGEATVTPIATYQEEPMEIAPLHYYTWRGTVKETVVTDIAGQWAGVQASHGDGTLVIFGHHPEIPPMRNGSIQEYYGTTIYGVPRYVYAWQGGEQLPEDYNWWIIRRSAAYVAGLPTEELPPL